MSLQECYHFTYLNRAFSINQTGLEPRNEENSKGIQDSKVKVFFSEGKDGAIGLFSIFYSTYKAIKAGARTDKIDPQIAEKVKHSSSFEEFLGQGMYLTFDGTHIINEKNKFDGVTESNIPPDNINVCLLRNNKTGEFSYSKYDFIQYLISRMTNFQLQQLPANVQEAILEYSKDYNEQIAEFRKSDYDIVQMSLEQFCKKYKADIVADIHHHTITDELVKAMLEDREDNYLLREGLCGQDLNNWDLSGLSQEMFRHLCFDSNTRFSPEQEEKFHPQELLNYSKNPGQAISQLHNQGITGKGVKIAIIDAKISDTEKDLLDGVNVQEVSNNKAGKTEQHGITVLSAFKQIAPDAEIYYFPYDKTSKDKDAILREYITGCIENGIKIISMSTSFNDRTIYDEVKALCLQRGVTLIDSETFYKDFSYCGRNIDADGTETYYEAFCEPEIIGVSEEKWKQYVSLFKKYNIDISNSVDLIKKLEESGDRRSEILKRLSGFSDILSQSTYTEVRAGFKQRLIEDEKNERKKNTSVEIPCAGKTFASAGKDQSGEQNYKYWATCSASYTIPQVAALFALSRQMDPQISYKNFTQLARSTSIRENDRMIISPVSLIKEIEARDVENQI